MKTITRKTMLYKTKVDYQLEGDGGQLNDYAMNHALGCSHGCKYPCYAMQSALRWKQAESYEDWCEPKLVENWQDLLLDDFCRLKDVKRAHLCFTTDPFPFVPEDAPDDVAENLWRIQEASMEAVELLNCADIPVTLLTKGVLPHGYDQRLYNAPQDCTTGEAYLPVTLESPSGSEDPEHKIHGPLKENYYGITLTSLDERFRKEWEPGAAPYALRLQSLRDLHDLGCKTWVSMEPYPALKWNMGNAVARSAQSLADPHAGLKYLLDRIGFVDRIVFGRWNYNKEAPCDVDDSDTWYRKAADIVRKFCEEHSIECVIKKGTE